MFCTGCSTKDTMLLLLSQSAWSFWRFTQEIWVLREHAKSTGKICGTLYFEKTICRVLCERSNIISCLKKHLEFPEKLSFTHGIQGHSSKVKLTKKIHGTFQQYCCFFVGATQVSKKKMFFTWNWCKSRQIITRIENSEQFAF